MLRKLKEMERNLFLSPLVSVCTVLAVSKARFGEMVKKTRHLAPKANGRHVRESKIDIFKGQLISE